MKTLFRILSVGAILVAAVFILAYFAVGVGLWRQNSPVKIVLTDGLTAADQFLNQADPILEEVETTLGQVAQAGKDVGNKLGQSKYAAESQTIQSAQNFAVQFSQKTTDLYNQFIALHTNAQATEQTIANLIPRVPSYVNLIWIGVTLLLIWLALAQAGLIYLAILYLRTGGFGWPSQVQVSSPHLTTGEHM